MTSLPPSLDPDRMAFESHIGPHAAGQTLLSFLASRFTYFSSNLWQERIDKGEIHLNKGPGSGKEVLVSGDLVRYFAPKHKEPPVPTDIPVIFEDEDLLIVNKPAHIPVHPSGRYLRNTLIHILQKQRPKTLLLLGHRLDRETTGVCVLTKTHLAKEKIYWQFFKGEVEKVYWALTWGKPEPKSGIVDASIGTAMPSQSKIRIKQVVSGKDSKTAKTKYHTLGTQMVHAPEWAPPPWPGLEAYRDKKNWPISLVECRPVTGRTNQIRVHLASIGCGLLGDKLYDPDEDIFLNWKEEIRHNTESEKSGTLSPELKRRMVLNAHALHAKSLKLRHPRTAKIISFEAPPPKTWLGLYKS